MNNDQKLFEEFLAFKKFQESQPKTVDEKPRVKKKTSTNKYTKRPDGRYGTKVSVGRDPETGKTIRIQIYASTIAELEDYKAELLMDKKKGVKFAKRNITVRAYRGKWFESKKIGIGYRTIEMYEYVMKNYFTEIDHMQIIDVEKSDLQNIINANKTKERTCQKIKMVMNEVFSAAVDDDIIVKNPAHKLVLPKYKSKERRSLTDDEDYLTDTTELTEREKALITLIKYFGLRKEEVLALMSNDFDFNKKQLTIRRAVIFIKNQPVYKTTKNGDERILPIISNVFHFLHYYVSNLQSNLLFTNINDPTKITEQGFKRMWEQIILKLKEKASITKKIDSEDTMVIETDLTPHIFRHNYACMLMYAGVDMKERQYLLGHKTIAMTMDIYTHIDTEKMHAPDKLESYVLSSTRASIK